MRLRDAAPADARAIADLWNPWIRDTAITFNSVERPPDEIADMIRRRQKAGHGFVVAEQDAGLVGFATYTQLRPGSGYARTMEHTLILSPGARGQGLGGLLLDRIESHASAAGALSIFAGVSSENPPGLMFHKRRGYREVAVLERVGWKFGRWMDLHLMQKFL